MDTVKLRNGVIAGFTATVALTILLIMKNAMGIMPALDPIAMLAGMMGMPAVVGWIGHFMIGTVLWGGLYAAAEGNLPGGTHVVKGMVLGVGAWLIMMIVLMPMAGAGLFGFAFGMMGPVMTLLMHVIFGAVLGLVYQALDNKSGAPAPA